MFQKCWMKKGIALVETLTNMDITSTSRRLSWSIELCGRCNDAMPQLSTHFRSYGLGSLSSQRPQAWCSQKAVLSANNFVSCRLVIWQGCGQCWETGDFLMAWRQVCWQTPDKQHVDMQCADLMPVSLAILQEKSTHRCHRYPSSFAGGLGAMAPYDASEEVAPPFQSLYFSNVPWQVARYHQNPRDEIFWVWAQPLR